MASHPPTGPSADGLNFPPEHDVSPTDPLALPRALINEARLAASKQSYSVAFRTYSEAIDTFCDFCRRYSGESSVVSLDNIVTDELMPHISGALTILKEHGKDFTHPSDVLGLAISAAKKGTDACQVKNFLGGIWQYARSLAYYQLALELETDPKRLGVIEGKHDEVGEKLDAVFRHFDVTMALFDSDSDSGGEQEENEQQQQQQQGEEEEKGGEEEEDSDSDTDSDDSVFDDGIDCLKAGILFGQEATQKDTEGDITIAVALYIASVTFLTQELKLKKRTDPTEIETITSKRDALQARLDLLKDFIEKNEDRIQKTFDAVRADSVLNSITERIMDSLMAEMEEKEEDDDGLEENDGTLECHLRRNRQMTKILQDRLELLEKKQEREFQKAKKFMKLDDRPSCRECLLRRKNYMEQQRRLTEQIVKLETMNFQLEEAEMQRQIVDVTRQGTQALRDIGTQMMQDLQGRQ